MYESKGNTEKRHLSRWKKTPFKGQGLDLARPNEQSVRGTHSQYLPGVLEATQWTVRSPVTGLDSTLRSVGGDRAARKGKQIMTQAWET